jgi:hypothetical protein
MLGGTVLARGMAADSVMGAGAMPGSGARLDTGTTLETGTTLDTGALGARALGSAIGDMRSESGIT